WQSYTDVVIPGVTLSAGTHEMRLDMITSGFNLNYVEFRPLQPAGPDETPPTAILDTSSTALLPDSTEDAIFRITYSDNSAVQVSSLDSGDLSVTAPDGVTQIPVGFIMPSSSNNSSSVTASYTIPAPDGSWDAIEAGLYTVSLNGNEVVDTSLNPASAGSLGTFEVAVQIPPSDGIIRINSGSTQDKVDSLSKLWNADTYFTNGSNFGPVTNEIADTVDDFIYQSQRTGTNFSYAIPIENGNYIVKFHLAELEYADFNQRKFDVSIENELFFDNLDIFFETKNAFLDGSNTAKVLSASDFFIVQDGELNLDFTSELNAAAIAGLEILPILGHKVLIKESNGDTLVTEGSNSDSYVLLLNSQPASDVTINIQSGTQLTTDKTSLVFTSANWNVPQTVAVSAVDDSTKEGFQTSTISHSVDTIDTNYSGLTIPSVSVGINDNDSVEVKFEEKLIGNIESPTTVTWGPDGRLYVGTVVGEIAAYTLDDDYSVIATEVIDTLSAFNGVSNSNILGIAFNPFENVAGSQPRIYVAHSRLYANGGAAFDPLTTFSPYSGQISVLEGPDFSIAQPLITGIGVSNHDHGVNGLEFDDQGNLLITVGSNTNAGIADPFIGGLEESPFTAAILKANITNENFNGTIQYEFPEGWVAPDGLTLNNPEESQGFGGEHLVVPGVDVSVYASGFRNPYDLEWTTKGILYATDNGANEEFGDVSTGPDTQEPFGEEKLGDELNIVIEENYYGSPNRSRGRTDLRQNVYYAPTEPSNEIYTSPIHGDFLASTNGLTEYRSTTFGGQLRGNLLAQRYNSLLYNVKLSADGTQVLDVNEIKTNAGTTSSLDILTGFSGAIVGADYNDDKVIAALPVDSTVGSNMIAYDILEWRAPATGNGQFVIGGTNFSGSVSDTTVTIGDQQATVASVTSSRIFGTLPTLSFSGDPLLDIAVNSNGQTSTITDAFQPLFV
ncbi:PQQ-dependent sugar dehydrogenase, partial [Romeria aff. gracilis LEGE 07310]